MSKILGKGITSMNSSPRKHPARKLVLEELFKAQELPVLVGDEFSD